MNSKRPIVIGLIALMVILAIIVGIVVAINGMTEAPSTGDGINDPSQEQVEVTPEPTPIPMIPEMAELYEKNNDVVGWIKIPGTKVDYAVVHTPDDPQKYLNLNLEGEWSGFGTIFIEGKCSMDPRSTNLLFHGHNMLNGSMFRTVTEYKNERFFDEHPIIEFSDLYQNKQYEIFAVVRDRIYHNYETCFKYYEFLDPATEEEFNEGIAYFKEHSLYETGITPVYGDKLITLSTCAYHTEHGRMLVLAREITEPAAAPQA